MAVPDFQSFFLPLLKYSADGEIPDELKVLLGLNPAGKSKFVEADSNLKDFENIREVTE